MYKPLKKCTVFLYVYIRWQIRLASCSPSFLSKVVIWYNPNFELAAFSGGRSFKCVSVINAPESFPSYD
jgi:hypothetical protein